MGRSISGLFIARKADSTRVSNMYWRQIASFVRSRRSLAVGCPHEPEVTTVARRADRADRRVGRPALRRPALVPVHRPRPAGGVAEIICALLLLTPRTRRLGAWATVALLVAVLPANVQMALDGGYPDAPFPANSAVGAWLRLPLQVPLVWWALSLRRPPEGWRLRLAPRRGR